ncbi:hypothetical protein PCNPT3_10995 [Psychromonas sp. CNPT3]|uniref:hypothetical protein n=1 Tax=Psychromonas sp. CNPT3 TaxID=314282 RepID=UPI00006E4266|nr:hypothetical protein [Psychromonas sp. CNPT3]AGH82135.1 hypothetical protein PCNPT3_10995 [Psychromonas sp. CNPT3]
MDFDWVEWFGYLASLVVLVSLTMSSIVKLRVINFIGCLLFASFAYFINSWPTIVMNLSIACINIYYLYHIYHTEENFKILSANKDSEYFQHFLSVNEDDIALQITKEKLHQADTALYLLRDDNIVGILVGNCDHQGTFTIELDYVTSRYRDFKLGSYYYNDNPELLKSKGFKELKAYAHNNEHAFYLKKVGFSKHQDKQSTFYTKTL